LNQAIVLAERATTKTTSRRPERLVLAAKLRKMYGDKFEHTDDQGDLDMAWVWAVEEIDKTQQNMTNYGTACSSILTLRRGDLYRRYVRLGKLSDLNEAIIRVETAIDTYAAGSPFHNDMLNVRSGLLRERFDRVGGMRDLELAEEINEEIVRRIRTGDPESTSAIAGLGGVLYKRFGRIGDLGDLQKAIKHAEDALAATPLDHPDRAAGLNNLGNMLSARFERTLETFKIAIKHGDDALATTPLDHPLRATMHINLGAWFSRRFERIGDLGDLQKAIKHGDDALATTPLDHPFRATIHSNLGAWFSTRFERIGDLGDLQKAIKLGEHALAATPLDHPDRALRHNHLGDRLSTRFERIGDLGDLQKSISHGEEALAGTLPDHPHRVIMCTSLARSSQSRFLQLKSPEDFTKCLSLYHEAFHCVTSRPRSRIHAARRAATLLYLAGKFPESSSILEDAVNLMPHVDLRFLARDDQQHMLSQISGLASVATSMALQAGREPYHGLKLLELGRGIIMGFSIDARSEASDLKADHPLVFHQFNSLRVEIDSEIDGTNCARGETPEQRQTRAISRRYEAVHEMEKILKRIRSLPGYDGFLLPPPHDSLMQMATNGPIVVFNSTPFRSDAIIVTVSGITSIELPKFTYDDTISRMKQLASFGRAGYFTQLDNQEMKELLIWLWDTAVGPVFDHLEPNWATTNEGPHDTNLKRIWWIGVGQLSMAPFHAAGDHSGGSTHNTFSRAISTYIPTIKALSYAQRPNNSRTSKKHNPCLLLIPMPETPGAPRLPGVDKEIRYIRDSASKNLMELTVLRNPTPAKVLRQVQRHDIVHFACHGMSELNPSDSYLALFNQDGNAIDKLLARDISKLVSENAQIAYLSACSTARNSSAKLADEVIHLASAFQLAGFSHTFANLWETNDQAACEVARDFYHLLFQNHRNNDDDHRRVSIAFYTAVKQVRDRSPGNPFIWAPFMHTGA
ncbi:unnamed protein product, partial [Tuber aestivum]